MTQDEIERMARAMVASICADDVCAVRDARSCGCFADFAAALRRAHSSGLESAARLMDEGAVGFGKSPARARAIRALKLEDWP